MFVSRGWLGMARPSARPRERKAAPPSAMGGGTVVGKAPALTREVHELADGRYLLAYGRARRDVEA